MKFKRRPTKKLYEVIDTDLLTATERLIKSEIDGFYAISDEQAYFKTSSDKSSMTINEFERHLQTKVHPNFMIIYNPNILPAHKVQGHQILLYVDAYKGVIPVCKVGKNADRRIQANSVGKVVKYEGKTHAKTDGAFMDEEPILYRGWVAAEEACKRLIEDVMKYGVLPSRVLSMKDFITLRKVVEQVDGELALRTLMKQTKDIVDQQLEEDRKKRIAEEKEIEKKAEDFIVAATQNTIEQTKIEEQKDDIQS